jgi:ATP-dependent Clp protease adapter protein ClpS
LDAWTIRIIYTHSRSVASRQIAINPEFCYNFTTWRICRVPTEPLEIEHLEEEVLTNEPAKVILFNDEVHTFEEVITQIIKAIHCAREKAEVLTWEVHNNGRAIVYAGEMIRCVEVSAVLEEIQLMTQIEV